MEMLYTVDVQRCFYDPDNGNLYVKDAEKMLPNILNLNEMFRINHQLEVGSADAHLETDDEFKINGGTFPFHAIYGTDDAKRPAYMDFYRQKKEIGYWYKIDNIDKFFENDFDENNRTTLYIYIFLKNDYSVEANPNFFPVMKYLIEKNSVEKIYIVGFTTDYCIKAAINAFYKIKKNSDLEFQIYLVEDAITGIDKEESKKAVENFKNMGVKIIKTEDLIDSM